uniref:Succinate dehydrogenase assembly factor 4, mitochondrial n=1 Tax=Mandrillus leucophaeus TaxID=9568 RepID=A0A2K5ZY77_MANLE
MTLSRLPGLLSRVSATAWRAARSPLLCHSLRKTSSSQGGKSELVKQSLKKPKLPEGRFDAPEDSHLEKEPLESNLVSLPLVQNYVGCLFEKRKCL